MNLDEAEKLSADMRAAHLIKTLTARIQELEAMLESIGAGGVSAQRVTQEEAQQPTTGEPVLTVEKEPDYWASGHFYEGNKPHINPTKVWHLPIGTKLYTHPAPSVPADVVRDAIAAVREQYRGTDWGKAAECICDAIDAAIAAAKENK